MSAALPPAVRAVLACAALLVPAHRRTAWRRQWEAEIRHRRVAGGPNGLFRFTLGCLAHAWSVRRGEISLRGALTDLVHAARGAARRPGPTAMAVATLAVGIGAATAIFSLAEALLLRPLPLPASERLVRLYSTNPSRGFSRFSVSYPDFEDLTGRGDLFERASFYTPQSRDVSGEGDAERVSTVAVHGDFFQTLGSPTLLGRAFVSEDHRIGAEPTAVLSESFWVRRFGADSTLLGRSIRLDGVPHTVVGVVADRHGWPAGTQVWAPLQWGGTAPSWADARSNHTWQVVARLQPGIRTTDASARLRAMSAALYTTEGIDPRDAGTEVFALPLHSSEAGDGVGVLFATLGTAVFLVLLISCINASGLLLARAAARTRELSLRAALGAGRTRLLWTLMGESLVVGSLAGILGVAVGVTSLERAFALTPPDIRLLGEIRLNGAVLGAALAISVLASLLAGLVPALRASRVSVAEALKDGGAQAGRGRTGTRGRRALVVAELAFSLALLVAAGLTVRGFQRQIASDPGFRAEGLLSLSVRLPSARYGDAAAVAAFYDDALARLRAQPGVLGATATSRLPLGAGGYALNRSFVLDGAPAPPEGPEHPAAWIEIDPAFLATLDITPREGRGFTAEDRADGAPVAIVNERLARQLAPEGSVVGRQIRSIYDENLPRTVVGVLPDIQLNGVSRSEGRPLVFVPRAQSVRAEMAFLVRTADDPSTMIPAVRRAFEGLDADLALDRLQPLRDAHAADLSGIRFLTTLFATFGALGLVLAVSGVYGLVSYSVSERRREIGVRVAMGATLASVRTGLLYEFGRLTALGLGVGSLLAYGAGLVLERGMDGVATLEPSTFVTVAAALAAAVLTATWVPATRAARLDPVDALRSE